MDTRESPGYLALFGTRAGKVIICMAAAKPACECIDLYPDLVTRSTDWVFCSVLMSACMSGACVQSCVKNIYLICFVSIGTPNQYVWGISLVVCACASVRSSHSRAVTELCWQSTWVSTDAYSTDRTPPRGVMSSQKQSLSLLQHHVMLLHWGRLFLLSHLLWEKPLENIVQYELQEAGCCLTADNLFYTVMGINECIFNVA